MRTEILYVDNCPNWREAGRLVSRALSDLGISGATVVLTLVVSTSELAATQPFSGSPTILIDGTDPFPSSGAASGLSCRLYSVDGLLTGIPDAHQIRAALAHAAATI